MLSYFSSQIPSEPNHTYTFTLAYKYLEYWTTDYEKGEVDFPHLQLRTISILLAFLEILEICLTPVVPS